LKASDEAKQLKQAEAKGARLLEEEREKTAALVREAAAVRQELTASAAQHRQAIDEERARSAALASELAGKSREIETQAAQSQKAVGEAVQQKQAAESTIAELQQSLQQEQKKTTALMQEAKAAQAMATAAEPQRRARLEGCAKIGTSPNRIGVVQHAPLYLPLAWNLMRVNMRVVPIN
jgi:chromosome segregation ATPase